MWCQCNLLTSSLIFIWGHVKYKFRYFCMGLTEKLLMTFSSLPVVPWTMLCMIDWWGLTVDVRLNEPENWTVTSWFQVIKVTDLFLYKTIFFIFKYYMKGTFFIWKLLIQVFCQNYIFTFRDQIHFDLWRWKWLILYKNIFSSQICECNKLQFYESFKFENFFWDLFQNLL